MNWLDIIIIVAVVVSALIGLKTGLINAALSLAGLIVGVILAGRYHVLLSEKLSFIPQANIAKIVAFAIILIGVMVIAAVLANLLKGVVSAVGLGWVNRIGGAVFGLVLGAIFCGALLAVGVKFLSIEALITDSRLAPLLIDLFRAMLALLPDEFDVVQSFFP